MTGWSENGVTRNPWISSRNKNNTKSLQKSQFCDIVLKTFAHFWKHWEFRKVKISLQLVQISAGNSNWRIDAFWRFTRTSFRILFQLLLLFLHSFLSSACANSADLMPIFSSSSTSSPLWCICKRISQPPMNSPLKKTWGMVGQLE